MILTAHALLNRNDAPSREDIVEAISGNICRCTGYGQIVEAIELAAERLRRTNVPRHLNGADPNEPSRDPAAERDAPEHGMLEAARVEAPHGGRR
jgi:carbon-monoxide dehydrogenase small subunit